MTTNEIEEEEESQRIVVKKEKRTRDRDNGSAVIVIDEESEKSSDEEVSQPTTSQKKSKRRPMQRQSASQKETTTQAAESTAPAEDTTVEAEMPDQNTATRTNGASRSSSTDDEVQVILKSALADTKQKLNTLRQDVYQLLKLVSNELIVDDISQIDSIVKNMIVNMSNESINNADNEDEEFDEDDDDVLLISHEPGKGAVNVKQETVDKVQDGASVSGLNNSATSSSGLKTTSSTQLTQQAGIVTAKQSPSEKMPKQTLPTASDHQSNNSRPISNTNKESLTSQSGGKRSDIFREQTDISVELKPVVNSERAVCSSSAVTSVANRGQAPGSFSVSNKAIPSSDVRSLSSVAPKGISSPHVNLNVSRASGSSTTASASNAFRAPGSSSATRSVTSTLPSSSGSSAPNRATLSPSIQRPQSIAPKETSFTRPNTAGAGMRGNYRK